MKRTSLIGVLCAAIISLCALPTHADVPTFNDVPVNYWAFTNIETLADSGITSGCGGGGYCPSNFVTRAQMAVFLERGINGSGFDPGPGTGNVFSDVPASYWAVGWVEQLAADGITSGCGVGIYCPDAAVTRAEMAVFLLRAKHGAAYQPPAPTGIFNDVATSYWAAGWIEQLAAEGITSGCGINTYCPEDSVTRDQMAVFLVRTFDLRASFNEALYAEPTVSSVTANKPERQFQANDGIDTDSSNGWVATEIPGTQEAWIQLTFDSPKLINRVVLTDSISLNAQLLDGVIEFSDGSNVSINGPLPNDGTPHDVVFTPRLTEWVRVRMTAANTSYQLAEIAAYSSLDPGQIRLAEDLFNDGDAVGWDDSNADCQTGGQSWDPNPVPLHAGAGNQYLQEGDCRGYSSDGAGVELGSYSLKSLDLPDGMDLRLSLRSDYRNADWLMGPMGVLFGYQDNNNYYRLDLSQVEGHRKLYKKEAGVYTELNTSPQSYVPEQWTNLRVVHKNGAILAYVNGSKVLAAEDSTFAGGKIALFCARNESCRFDNLILLSAPSAPIVGVNITDGPAHASSEYFVGAADSLEVAATVTESAGFGWVEFVIDEGTGNESSQEVLALPYSHTFSALNQGDHTVRAYLLDDNGQRLSDSGAVMELPQVATEGVQLVGMGNSIAGGLKDNITSDDTSQDLRNTSGGFQSVLNDRLSIRSTMPISILSEGNAGENSAEGLARIEAVLKNNPAAQGYLLLYGANDARSSKILPSGLGMNSAQAGYNDTFKGHMDQIFSAILAAGKQVFPGKALPKLENGSPNGPNVAPLNAALQEFNQVIDELLLEKGLSGSYTAPDFYSYFIAHPAEMDADGIHPNGNGYKSLARGWCESLDGQLGLRCNDRL